MKRMGLFPVERWSVVSQEYPAALDSGIRRKNGQEDENRNVIILFCVPVEAGNRNERRKLYDEYRIFTCYYFGGGSRCSIYFVPFCSFVFNIG